MNIQFQMDDGNERYKEYLTIYSSSDSVCITIGTDDFYKEFEVPIEKVDDIINALRAVSEFVERKRE